MEIRRKLETMRTQITKSINSSTAPSSPIVESQSEKGPCPTDVTAAAYKIAANRTLPLSNPHKVEEVLNSIDPIYFDPPQSFDPKLYELKKLPEMLDINEINSNRKAMKEQLAVVSKKISDLILKNQPSYAKELVKVTALQQSLKEAHSVCVKARDELIECRKHTTDGGVKLIALHRRRHRLRSVYDSLNAIRALQHTHQTLNQLMQEGKYCEAIELCADCEQSAEEYSQYDCIGELGYKVSDSSTVMASQLDSVLREVVVNEFHSSTYSKLVSAYSLLDNCHPLPVRLLHNLPQWIADKATNIVGQYVQSQADYEMLCKNVDSDCLVDCLQELCSSLWRILHAYDCILAYHRHMQSLPGSTSEHSEILNEGQRKVWECCVAAVEKLVSSTSAFNSLKFDQFIRIIQLCNRFISVGAIHLEGGADKLLASLTRQTSAYLASYHNHRLQELHMFMESESWTRCPVPSSFCASDLAEFQFLRNKSDVMTAECERGKLMDVESENPFVDNGDEGGNETIGSIDSEDEQDGHQSNQRVGSTLYDNAARVGPVLCNTAVSLLRLVGRYVHLMSLLPPVAPNVFSAIQQLFNYYLCTVVSMFGGECSLVDLYSASVSLVLNESHGLVTRLGMPSVSPSVSLSFVDSLFALSERVVATESLVFVSCELNRLESVVEPWLPAGDRDRASVFFGASVRASVECRRVIYGGVSGKCINYDRLLQYVSNVNWDVSELMSQHNAYVDFLVQDLENFKLRLDTVARNHVVPWESYATVWNVLIQCINRVLVEGYSCARKCSNEGRALMQLDYQQLVRRLEKLTTVKPLPDMQIVNVFVKAFYLPESAIDQWIHDNKSIYTCKQMLGLVQVANIGRKTRLRLAAYLQESHSFIQSS